MTLVPPCVPAVPLVAPPAPAGAYEIAARLLMAAIPEFLGGLATFLAVAAISWVLRHLYRPPLHGDREPDGIVLGAPIGDGQHVSTTQTVLPTSAAPVTTRRGGWESGSG
ncbi:hypothetical protein ACFY5F_50570 [Streptomyces sp. NPDC013161]|uniref:hypothetical protein n=1 Tax=Streptomyces sp. NPDC013161 TaxID=3364862 RepID=UPI00369C1832